MQTIKKEELGNNKPIKLSNGDHKKWKEFQSKIVEINKQLQTALAQAQQLQTQGTYQQGKFDQFVEYLQQKYKIPAGAKYEVTDDGEIKQV